MKHTLIAESLGEGYGGLFEIHYLAENRAQTPIQIAKDMSQEWAEQLVLAYNSHPDLLEALRSMRKTLIRVPLSSQGSDMEIEIGKQLDKSDAAIALTK